MKDIWIIISLVIGVIIGWVACSYRQWELKQEKQKITGEEK